jgi:hypothetical protein
MRNGTNPEDAILVYSILKKKESPSTPFLAYPQIRLNSYALKGLFSLLVKY